MKKQLPLAFLLGAAGGLLVIIGASILADPQSVASRNGIGSQMDVNLVSELRAPSGLLIGSGVFMLMSVARYRWRLPALFSVGAVYGSYGLSRLVGVILDGMPSVQLVQAMGFELSMGAVCLLAAFWLRRRNLAKPSSRQFAGDLL